jgi:hypothetical protein
LVVTGLTGRKLVSLSQLIGAGMILSAIAVPQVRRAPAFTRSLKVTRNRN